MLIPRLLCSVFKRDMLVSMRNFAGIVLVLLMMIRSVQKWASSALHDTNYGQFWITSALRRLRKEGIPQCENSLYQSNKDLEVF